LGHALRKADVVYITKRREGDGGMGVVLLIGGEKSIGVSKRYALPSSHQAVQQLAAPVSLAPSCYFLPATESPLPPTSAHPQGLESELDKRRAADVGCFF
jgi:hypothetical protein